MGKVKGYKKIERQTFNDGVKASTAAPKFAVIPTTRRDETIPAHPFDAVPARRKREAALEPEGVVKKSGSDKPLEKIKANPISKYKKAAGAKFGTVAHHEPALFEREAAKDGHD
jgi:hypothetical protein